MLTLYKTTQEIKSLGKWAGIIIGAFIGLILLFRIGGVVKELLFPTPLPPPDTVFGKLTQLTFPQNASETTFTYSLNTVSGALPKFPDRLKAYRIIALESDLLALQRATERVAKIGFTDKPIASSSIVYQWNDPNPPFRKIIHNIRDLNFNLSSNFLFDPDILAAKNLPNENDAITKAQSFLSDLSSLTEDLDTAKTKATLLAIRNFQLTLATSLSTTQIIRVDFFQKDIDDLSIYYPHPPYSTMNVFVGTGAYRGQVVMANYYRQPIDIADSATYPIYSASEALSRLKNGNAYIASYYGTGTNITITKVSLGYYLGEDRQDFLIPIAVFEGNDGFVAYLTIITDDWFAKE